MRSLQLVVGSFALVVSSFALAQQGPPRGPPQEALTACSGLSAGAACAFTHHGQNLTGTCRSGPDGTVACAPAGGPPGHGPRTPPPEASAACRSSSAGAACSFSVDGRTLSGTCDTPPGASSLACRPAGMGRHGPPPEASAACQSSSAGAACSFSVDGHTVSGTCDTPPGASSLACRPAGMGRHGPPPEASAACQSSSAGAACSFSVDGRTVSGTCDAPPGASSLACRPAGMGPHGPPPEAFAACASLSEGASCAVTFRGEQVIGSCVSGPQGGRLACLPPRP
ncbi:MAG: hypothetical protein ACOZQL_41125 [Myxococcota bacterium]